MTYRQLLAHLENLSSEELDMDVTVRNFDGEYYPAKLQYIVESSILEIGQPILILTETNNE